MYACYILVDPFVLRAYGRTIPVEFNELWEIRYALKYVGSTANWRDRYSRHCNPKLRRGQTRATCPAVLRWELELKELGEVPGLYIVDEVPTREQVRRLERRTIRELERWQCPLLNERLRFTSLRTGRRSRLLTSVRKF